MNKNLYFGTAWYPEHWATPEWNSDLDKMRAAHMNVVRLGEFAWSAMEPTEGNIQLDWLEEAVDLAVEHGMKVVLCTPTAAPPAWLSVNYPETLAQDPETDQMMRHGARCHYDRCSSTFLKKSELVIHELGKRFGSKKGVIGWQLDNEGLTPSRRQSTVDAFVSWLKDRYGNLSNLNETWTTRYWSQEYSDWNQLDVPVGNANPGLYLAWHRFLADSIKTFHKHQIDILREHISKEQWITHNFHLLDTFDRYNICEDLDFVSYDAYVWDDKDVTFNYIATGLECDRIQGMKDMNFWLMETQPGFINWKSVNACQPPGVTRLMGLHFLGHGADACLYWQWRPALCCQEQYHGSVLHAGGQPRPIYDEIKQLGKDYETLSPYFIDTKPVADVSLLDSWQDRHVLKKQPHHKDYKTREIVLSWYGELRKRGLGVEVLPNLKRSPRSKVLIAPYAHLLSREDSEKLRRFVENGGSLVLGARSGFKDEENRLFMNLQPGHLKDWLPFSIVEYYAINGPAKAEHKDGTAMEGRYFVEKIEQLDATSTVLARFEDTLDWVGGTPAVITGKYGKGQWVYLALIPDVDGIRQLLNDISNLSVSAWTLPEGVELLKRENEDGKQCLIFLNYNDYSVTVAGLVSIEIPPRDARCFHRNSLNGQLVQL